MYQFDDSYDPYPKPINLIIEKAYQSQVPFAEWDEEDGLYRLDFQRMEEMKNKDGKSVVKVKRMTAGWCFECFDTTWWGHLFVMMGWCFLGHLFMTAAFSFSVYDILLLLVLSLLIFVSRLSFISLKL